MNGPGKITRLLRIERTVSSLMRSVMFYRDALGFTVIDSDLAAKPHWQKLLGHPMRAAQLRLGQQELVLTQFDSPGKFYPADSESNDLWFQHCAIVVTDMRAVYSRLMQHECLPITLDGPQQLPPNTGSVTAFKFRDPDGHPLELISFPHSDIWKGNALTLGIDHSAISVSDVDASVDFYTEVLGLAVTAHGKNVGPEQDRLDNLKNVTTSVLALETQQKTPHLELLCYQTPKGRKPDHPVEPRDIAGDRLVFAVDDVEALIARLEPPPLKTVPGAALLRDPDGHLLILEQDEPQLSPAAAHP
jgi:catechol 2,3-dioxygenase-like lactoylglutathione lyase family enzyme